MARKEGRTVRFATLMVLWHLKNSENEPKFQGPARRGACTLKPLGRLPQEQRDHTWGRERWPRVFRTPSNECTCSAWSLGTSTTTCAPHSCSTLRRRAPGIRELSSADVVDTWLLKVNPCRGSILHADEFVDAVRFRLGCAGPVQPTVCAACNTGLLDTGAPAARWEMALVVQVVQEAAHSCASSAELRFFDSVQALSFALLMYLTPPLAALSQPWMSPSARNTHRRPALTAPSPWLVAGKLTYYATTSTLSTPRTSTSGVPMADITPPQWPSCAPSASASRGRVMWPRSQPSSSVSMPGLQSPAGGALLARGRALPDILYG